MIAMTRHDYCKVTLLWLVLTSLYLGIVGWAPGPGLYVNWEVPATDLTTAPGDGTSHRLKMTINRSVYYMPLTTQATGAAATIDTTVTLGADVDWYLVDASGNYVEITLPEVAVSAGRTLKLKVTTAPGANVITLLPADGTIDGDASNTTVLAQRWDACLLYCDGNNWFIF